MANRQEQKDDLKRQVIALITSLPESKQLELLNELKAEGVIT